MSDIIIIGGGGHAKVVISILKKINQYNIIGYSSLSNEGNILGVKYLGKDEDIIYEKKYKGLNVAIGIGQIDNLYTRKKIVELYLDSEFKFPAMYPEIEAKRILYVVRYKPK